MVEVKKKLAQMLIEHHPGIPNTATAEELVDSFFIVMRKFLLKEGEITFDGIGKLAVKEFSGSTSKRDARTGIVYRVTERNVLKFVVSPNFKKIINMSRKPSEKIADADPV